MGSVRVDGLAGLKMVAGLNMGSEIKYGGRVRAECGGRTRGSGSLR